MVFSMCLSPHNYLMAAVAPHISSLLTGEGMAPVLSAPFIGKETPRASLADFPVSLGGPESHGHFLQKGVWERGERVSQAVVLHCLMLEEGCGLERQSLPHLLLSPTLFFLVALASPSKFLFLTVMKVLNNGTCFCLMIQGCTEWPPEVEVGIVAGDL